MTEGGATRNGTFMTVITVDSWPPISDGNLYYGEVQPGSELVLRGTAEGVITAAVFFADDQSIICAASPPIEMVGDICFILTVDWDGHRVNLSVNGRDMLAADIENPVRIVRPKADLGNTLTSDAAFAACRAEVEARLVRYPVKVSKVARNLSLDEEKRRLADSIRSLREDVERVLKGDMHRMGSVRGAMRELTVWLGTDSYQPSLFRVAARVGAPLPICATKAGGIKELSRNLETKPMMHTSFGRFATEIFHAGELVDLEAWMRRPVIRDRAEGGTTYTAAQVIAKAAENFGGAHAGPSVPLTLDRLEATLMADMPSLSRTIVNLAKLVVELGEFVLKWPPK